MRLKHMARGDESEDERVEKVDEAQMRLKLLGYVPLKYFLLNVEKVDEAQMRLKQYINLFTRFDFPVEKVDEAQMRLKQLLFDLLPTLFGMWKRWMRLR